ncbi:15858_t:CDS:2 [Funneliformis mosseae]|uniref:15858_t:CDS:1 n=1 Tax=Funneliformis mosseae TaxID=27381 RepID=A0A9N9DYR3_FUNMO|nr:15858_t:CDS:2 [Funneliformis mosseae]
MEESKFSEEVIEQIKDIIPWGLSDENNLLIDKLILNDNLKTRYKTYGLCRECYQPNTSCDTSDFGYVYWCQSCNATRFEQDFKNWTSGDHHVDELVQKSQLKAKNYKEVIEWYNYQFEDVKTLIKDKSGITYTASWYGDLCMLEWDYVRNSWKRYNPGRVILRYLHDEPDNPVEFLKKVESRIAMNGSPNSARLYGITKDPKTGNFMMVMELKHIINFRDCVKNSNNNDRLKLLRDIARGLKDIHNNGLIHRNFHCGSLSIELDHAFYIVSITDLGSSQPANPKSIQDDQVQVYGVLPYVAPEILVGNEHTQAADIYGFGMIAYEIMTKLPPYHDVAHDESLASRICQGLRPSFNCKVPPLILDIIQRCWDADPSNRPNANELYSLLYKFGFDAFFVQSSLAYRQVLEAYKINSSSFTGFKDIKLHPQAVYTSKLLTFKDLPNPQNADVDQI